MKILRLVRSLDPRSGGPVEGIRQFTSLLNVHGWKTTVATLDDPSASWLQSSEFEIQALGPSRGVYGYSSLWRTWLDQNVSRFDLVVIHGIWQYHAWGSWRVLRKKKIPYILYPHGMLDPWWKRRYPLKHLKKWLYWPWADYRVVRDAQAVVFTTEQERILARESFWLYQAKEVVLPYGIRDPISGEKIHDFSKNQEERWTHKNLTIDHPPLFRILFIARLHPKKNLELLLRAFQKLAIRNNQLRLIVGGSSFDSEYEQSLHRLAHQELGIAENRIEWRGFISGEEKKSLFLMTDLFVLPSHQENFGFSVIESLAYGVPVVISRGVNVAEEIEQGGGGGVFDGSLEDLIFHMSRWIERVQKDQLKIHHCCRELYLKNYNLTLRVPIWIDFMKKNIQSYK